MRPFTYRRKTRDATVALSYWQAPAELLEDGDELRRWAERAWAATQRRRAAAVRPQDDNHLIPRKRGR